jgi:hypothetical protein
MEPRMSRTAHAAVLVSLFATALGPIHAQSPNALVGKWSIEYERGRRVENGESTPIMGTAELTIAQSGDSLVATLVASARPDGPVPPPSTFGGRAKGDDVVFVQNQTVQINANGEMSTRDITLTWTLRAAGNALTGGLARELPMMSESLPPSPVKGTRAQR